MQQDSPVHSIADDLDTEIQTLRTGKGPLFYPPLPAILHPKFGRLGRTGQN